MSFPPPPLTARVLLTRSRIADFLRRLTQHAAQTILAQVPLPNNFHTTKPTKVGAWLTNQIATDWDNVRKHPVQFDDVC